MTGPEHYRAAEQQISSALEFSAEGDMPAHNRCLAIAQVHATLALAAAIAMGPEQPADDWDAWYPIASEGPRANRRRRDDERAEMAEAAAEAERGPCFHAGLECDRRGCACDCARCCGLRDEAEHDAEQERRQAAHDEYLNDRLAEEGRWG